MLIPNSNIASSPNLLISLSNCDSISSTISSIRPGWTLPSSKSLLIALEATSLLKGLCDETVTTPGVSSIIISTPVFNSIARIFLPSLPIILPFISSLGKFTIEAVFSEV